MNFSTTSLLASKKNQGFGRIFTSMLLVIILMIAAQRSFGQNLLNEDLTALVTGNLGGQTGWTQTGSGPVATVASASPITYGNGYPGGGGNYALMPTATGTTSRCYRTLSATPTGSGGTNTFYYSFILNIATATATGDYFATLGDPTTGTVYFGRVFAKTSGGGYVLGLSKAGNVGAALFGSTVLSFNTSYLIVCRYSFVTGTTNDLNYLWINPNVISEPTTGTAETSDNTTTDAGAATVGNFLWHNRTANNPTGKFDDIKVAAGASSAAAWSNLGANTINGTIAAGEYGTHTNGQNQNTNSGNITYMSWDNTNLYVAVSGANLTEGLILYLDKHFLAPVNGGTDAHGTLIGQNYDGANFGNLPWRADLVMYVKQGYREYRTATGSNTWSSATPSFGGYAESGSVREFAIPWSVVGGKPNAFNFFSYNVSSTGFVYNTQPTENATGFIGTSARYERYYTISSTFAGNSTPPFSQNSFVFNNVTDETAFGAISVYDFTMNTAGRFISRTGATGSNWTIAHDLMINNGTVYFGSGGTNGLYGATTVNGTVIVHNGGILDLDQTTSPLLANGSLSLSSGGVLKLSGNNFGGGDLKLIGQWNNTGGIFLPNSRAVFLEGNLGGHAINSTGGETFDYLIVNMSSPAGLVFPSDDVTINQGLTLTNGIIVTPPLKTLIIGNSSPGAVSRTNGYIRGSLRRAVATGTSIYDYAVGTDLGYTPVSITFGGTTGAGTVTVASINGASSNYPPTLSATKRLDRYWSITNSGVSGFTADATFNYLGADLVGGATSSTVHPYKFDAPSTFTDPPFTSGANSFTVTGLNSFSEFGAGECTTICQNGGILDVQTCGCQCLSGYSGVNCEVINRSITSSVTGTTFCAGDALTVGYNAIAPVPWNAGNIFTAQLSDASGSFASPVNIGSVSSTATGLGSISATIPSGTSFGTGYRIRVVSSDPVVTGTDNGADLTINPNYTITASAGANGSISPNGLTNHCSGTNQTYTITADACYSIADVIVDGVSQGAVGTYTFTNITANHTISASFVLNTYTITVTAGANGSITPATGSVNCGDNATYTITADACYSIADVIVDGVSQGAVGTYTFTNVTANHTISATFSLNTYTITVTAGANGSITPATGSVNCGDNATYTITPDACYSIADVIVDGVSQGAVGTYTFTNVTANHTISATFSLNTYTITVTAGANGSITPATGSVNCGDNATYTITADACYSIADVIVDGVSQGAVGTYTFTNITANHTISASFVLNTYTITVTAGANGSITPATGSVNCGDNATYTITADACYSIADVIVDGVSQGAVGTYTFTNVTANHTISATFSLNTYTITVTAGANGSITPATGSVNCGDNATYTITADACYSIADVIVDDVSQGPVGTYTFTNVTANHTISATFSLNTYTITVTAGANGSITPVTGSVNCGDNATYTITADACYSIADVIVDGVSQGAVGTYTFTNVTANHTISATFSLNTYTITVTAGANGSITPATGSVNCGDNATYTITPDACYSIADVIVDAVSQGAVGTYTFTNVTANHTISATFSLNTYTITVTAGANGSITPATGSVNCGDNATYTITPDACYSIADVIVDGVSQGPVGPYTFTNVTANHTISATFSLNTYTISVAAGANGSITPATGTVNCGDNATYTITPDACYSIADVIVDGVSQGALGTYTFTNVTANHTISATFSLNTYTITVTAGANGSITPVTGSVNCGDNATYTITADACYSIADVIVDGVSQGAVGTYTFTNVTANHTISATFALTTYTITVTSGANGSITPATGSVNCGDNATYTITADACYSIADVIVDGVSQGAVGTYTFTNVTANHTISATFAQVTYTITASSGPNGSVTPSGASIVNCGDNAAYNITPNACYYVLDVLVDGVSVGAVTTYTFTNVTANHTISATFAINAPIATPVVTGPVNVCPYVGTGLPITYTATSAGATGFTWVVPPTNVTIVSGQGTANLTVTFQNGFIAQGNKQLKVTALSPCGNSSQVIYYLVAQVPGTPGPITASSSNVCAVIGTPGTITYTINSVQGAASYNWSAQAGTTVINHPNGPGMNDTTVTVSFTNGFTSSNITVSASSAGCGTGGTRSLLISRSNPSTPGLISGPTNACPYMAPGGTPATYSVVLVPNATSYTWTVPAGAIGLTGQGTNTISFTYPNGFVSGSVTVFASNGCGNSGTRSLSISKLNPATPSIIDVIQTQPCPNRVYTYTLSGMPANATSVQWTVPVGATLVSGQGTISITVSYPPTAFNSVVTAQAFNNCGSSSIRTVPVNIPTCPLDRTPIAKGGSALTTPSVESMQVNVYPNPTVNDFKLQVTTAGKEAINVRILDLQGRSLKTLIVAAYQTTTIGSDLKAGTYMVEVRQGNNVKVTKLIKF